IPGKLWPMRKLLLGLALVVSGACGDNTSDDAPPAGEPPEVIPGCARVDGNLDSFDTQEAFAPAVKGTLAGWDPDGRWFLTGTRVGGVSSFHFERQGLQIIVDRDPTSPGKLDDDQLFQRGSYENTQGDPYTIARRISNMRSDGTARAERAVCFVDACNVCTAKLERATHNGSEGEGDNLTLASELKGASWGPGYTFNVRVLGTIAYLIRQDGLHMIETVDPAHPVELGIWKRAGDGYSNDVKLVEANGKRYALIADYPVDVVDVTDPTMARLVAQIPVEAHTLAIESRNAHLYVYFGAYDGTCPAFDITDPEAPARLGVWNSNASVVHDLMVDNGIAYLNAWEGGFQVVDFTNPSVPRMLGKWAKTPTGTSHSSWAYTSAGRKLALHGEEAYAAHLDIVDVDEASPTFIQSVGTFKTRDHVSIHNVMVVGGRAYMSYYQDGVRVLDVSDPAKPKQLGYYNTWDPQADYTSSGFFEGAVGLDVDLARKLIFVADSPRGLLILRDATF
ncbi:MAG: hypothetical protein ABI175_03230, partial [Polyangiales bacterium]